MLGYTVSVNYSVLVWPLVVARLLAMSQAPATFEVASVRVNLERHPIYAKIDRAMATFSGASVASLIARAYDVKPSQVSGPDWISEPRYDISATLPGGASESDVPAMLRALLSERFKLVVRRRSKEVSAYALRVGSSGLKTTQYQPGEPLAEGNPMTIARFAEYLSVVSDRPVIDETGLTGRYLFSIGLIKQAMLQAQANPPRDVASDPAPGIAAIAKTYGLAVVPKKVYEDEIIVVQASQTPTEN